MANTTILYNLIHGKNLVSFPFTSVVGTSISTPAGLATRITGSNGTSSISEIIGQSEACAFLTASNEFIGSQKTIEPEKGYWLTISGARQISITGELLVPNYYRQMNAGQNLVSFPFSENQTLSDVLNDVSGSTFNQLVGASIASTPLASGTWIGSAAAADKLTTGSAFWLNKTATAESDYINPWHSSDTDIVQTASSSFDYIPCTDGENEFDDGSQRWFSAQGRDCMHTHFFQELFGVDAVPEVHSFGFRYSSPIMHFMLFKDRHFSSASLVRADNTEISQSTDGHPPIVGFYSIPDAGPYSGSVQDVVCVGTATWPSTNPDYATVANESYSNSTTSGSHYIEAGITLDAFGGALAYATGDVNKPLIVRVYDPHRGKVYSAKVYNENNVETPLSGSNLTYTPYVGIDIGMTNDRGWRYIKTDI